MDSSVPQIPEPPEGFAAPLSHVPSSEPGEFHGLAPSESMHPRPAVDPDDPQWLNLSDDSSGENPMRKTAVPTRSPTLPDCMPAIPGFDILSELGRGGMGVVYKAWQIKLQRHVALKMILAGAYASSEQLIRFLAEAETLAKLQHHNIVKIHEIGTFDRKPYFALEYIEGVRLTDLLDGTPQPFVAAALLIEQVARAIHFAHERGIVHRDLKPANILLQKEGPRRRKEDKLEVITFSALMINPTGFIPKITDFGLAKHLSAGPGLTHTNEVLGTAPYMAPEQAQGNARDVGPGADVYSMGAILYELLTGRPPFKAANAMETMMQVMSLEPVSVARVQPKTPRDLATICMKCLEKEPRKRYHTAEALADDLRRFLAGEPIRARPATIVERLAKWARRRPATATMILSLPAMLLLGMAGALWGWHHAATARDEAERHANEAIRTRDEAHSIQEAATAAREKLERELYLSRLAQVGLLCRAGQLSEADKVLDQCPPECRGWEWRCLRQCVHPELSLLDADMPAAMAWHLARVIESAVISDWSEARFHSVMVLKLLFQPNTGHSTEK